MFRIFTHPLLRFSFDKKIRFTFDGQEYEGYEGDTIASALISLGVVDFHHSIKLDRPRGFFCALGNCSSCLMIVNDLPNVRICITPLEEGMVVKTQKGKGCFK